MRWMDRARVQGACKERLIVAGGIVVVLLCSDPAGPDSSVLGDDDQMSVPERHLHALDVLQRRDARGDQQRVDVVIAQLSRVSRAPREGAKLPRGGAGVARPDCDRHAGVLFERLDQRGGPHVPVLAQTQSSHSSGQAPREHFALARQRHAVLGRAAHVCDAPEAAQLARQVGVELVGAVGRVRVARFRPPLQQGAGGRHSGTATLAHADADEPLAAQRAVLLRLRVGHLPLFLCESPLEVFVADARETDDVVVRADGDGLHVAAAEVAHQRRNRGLHRPAPPDRQTATQEREGKNKEEEKEGVRDNGRRSPVRKEPRQLFPTARAPPA